MLRLEICPSRLFHKILFFRSKFRRHALCLLVRTHSMAIQVQHNFAIERLGRQSGWFKPDRYRYYCIRCHWQFLVEGRKVCALSDSCHPLPEPESSARIASFALGPCAARPPECLSIVRGVPRSSAHQKTTTVLDSIGTSEQSRALAWLKSVFFPRQPAPDRRPHQARGSRFLRAGFLKRPISQSKELHGHSAAPRLGA